ncbi:hypothetical protein HER32_08835 [Hymenobacter sp. BT18]|uniref:DUF5522 domain-containing protein n=1 Tax=Hymenobacter TaxID=89966 RepID=UPI00143E9017|nr:MULTISPECIES: DUF5522 domain-containing protein [Hymenobacter]QIX61279.1 hypothetical protein HER32_08835 [Hymenobacter sp. BT18]
MGSKLRKKARSAEGSIFAKSVSAALPSPAPQPLQPGDYYFTPEGLMVFTEQYHRRRGSCCGSGCRHCPWRKKTKNEE